MWEIVGALVVVYLICLAFRVGGAVIESVFPSLKGPRQDVEI